MNCSVEIDGDTAQVFHVWNVKGKAMADEDLCACGTVPWRLRGNRARKGNVTYYLNSGHSFIGWVEFEVPPDEEIIVDPCAGEMLNAVQAAERAGVSYWAIYRALGDGFFGCAESRNGKWQIPANAVDQWASTRLDRQKIILGFVATHLGARLNAIGELLGIKKTAAKEAVDKLIDAGLLRRDHRGQLVVNAPVEKEEKQ